MVPCWQPSPLPMSTPLLLKSTGLTQADSAKQTALPITEVPWKHFLPLGAEWRQVKAASVGWPPLPGPRACLPLSLANCPSPPPIYVWLEPDSWTGIRYPSLWTTPTPPVSGGISHAPGLGATVPPAKQPTPSQSDNAESRQRPHPCWASWLLGREIFLKALLCRASLNAP